MEHHFVYPSRGPGRPQILLIGNGLEYDSGQESWDKLLEHLTLPEACQLTQEQRKQFPFPLLYHLLSTPDPAPPHLTEEQLQKEDAHLKNAMKLLKHDTNGYLNRLPALNADHIMTTNYSYCLEKAFFPKLNFTKSSARSSRRLRLGGDEYANERDYRPHSCYLAKSGSTDTGLWHIHGECGVPKGIILSHDRYGRLLCTIKDLCSKQRYSGKPNQIVQREFTSWPELFLYGDVYILGLGMDFNEFDLWWLLRRKQREYYSDGNTYFYERRPLEGFHSNKHLMMQASGVILCDAGCTEADSYDKFYTAALKDIQERIAQSRQK